MILAKAQDRQNVVVIGGDFNLPNIDWSIINQIVGEQLDPLLDFFDKYPFEQIVSEPTRGNNTLDLIFTNTPEIITNVSVEEGISDHKVVLSDINVEIQKNNRIPRKQFFVNKSNFEGFRICLSSHFVEFEKCCLQEDVENCWNFS